MRFEHRSDFRVKGHQASCYLRPPFLGTPLIRLKGLAVLERLRARPRRRRGRAQEADGGRRGPRDGGVARGNTLDAIIYIYVHTHYIRYTIL